MNRVVRGVDLLADLAPIALSQPADIVSNGQELPALHARMPVTFPTLMRLGGQVQPSARRPRFSL